MRAVPALLVVAPAGAARGLRRAGGGLRDDAARRRDRTRRCSSTQSMRAGSARDSWWTNELLHTGGRWAIRALAGCSCSRSGSRPSSSATGVRCAGRPRSSRSATLLSIGVVGLLKTLTNVDCPWDLVPFGGRFPYVQLFADRPDALRLGRCFPAAHASSGYALLALYFAFRERHASAGEAGPWIGTVGRTDIRHRAAGARRAFRLARRVERVPRLDDHAVDLCIRIPRAAVEMPGWNMKRRCARRLAPDRAPCWPLRPQRRSCAGVASATCSTSCARRG